MNKILIAAIAAILAISQLGCTKPQQISHSADYSLLNPEQGQTPAERLKAQENAARAAELEALKQYEQADFEFMRGDAELDKKSN